MSYLPERVEREIRSAPGYQGVDGEMSERYSGSECIERQLKCDGKGISEFGKEVADILGQAWAGIYHLQKEVLHDRVKWNDDRYIRIVIYGDLQTYDFDKLTRLVVLCFDRMIRLEIGAAARNYLSLSFTKRECRPPGSFSKRLPYLEDCIAYIREEIGLPIITAEENDK